MINKKNYTGPQQRMSLLPNYYKWIYRHFANYISSPALELGCGEGLFLKHYIGKCQEILAVDYNKNLLEKINNDPRLSRAQTLAQDLTEEWENIPNGYFKSVIALDVLEHIENEHCFLKSAYNSLAENGYLHLKVPAQSALYSKMDQHSGHHRRYEKNDLITKLKAHNFTLIKCCYMNPVGSLVYRFRNQQKTNYSETFSPITLRAINTGLIALPLLDNIPFVKGLSLIGTFKKCG